MRTQAFTHLLFVDDVDARLDVGEGVRGGEDGLPLELLVQVAVRPPVQRERRAVDEAAQVVVLVKVRDAVLHLVRVEVRLHVGDLDVGLREDKGADGQNQPITARSSNTVTSCYLIGVKLALVYWVGVLDDFDLVLSEPLAIETLRENGTEDSSTVLSQSARAEREQARCYLPPACERFRPAW